MSLNYTITSPLEIKGTGSSPGQLIISDSTDSITVTIPPSLGSSYSFVLPSDSGLNTQILSRNSTGGTDWIDNVSGGIDHLFVTSLIQYTNTNTAYLLIPSMTLLPPEGTYYCVFNTSIDTTINDRVDVAMFVDGVIQSNSRREYTINRNGNNVTCLTSVDRISLNGAQTLDVRSRVTPDGITGTYTIFERILFIMRVGV